MHKTIENIRDIVRNYVCEKRFSHTLGVEKEAYRLGTIFIPEKAEKLQITGLLHDITKNFKTEKQLELCREYGIAVDLENLVPKLLHSKTGCEFARRTFGENVVDDEIYNGILYHTTGRENMSLFEAVIYLADYIEKTRDFKDCIRLRKYFYDNIENANSYEDKIQVLRKTMIYSFDLTIKNLIDGGKRIDKDTINARNYFISCKDVFKN
ncbi:MAG: bis(5'-nucleosyl)-tetraphosphatase (symmetrical) YqeK [Clostridia bacterium]|nr:bis(5'-nucleosyl)-tetraphosphatase (symmetrical) YqeK [Clostridia bacterium]